MRNNISLKGIAELLQNGDRFTILIHRDPDGDTIGSGFALHYALRALGKKSRVLCSHDIPSKFLFLADDSSFNTDEPDGMIISVDIATPALIGDKYASYGDKIELCIDHHPSNEGFAKHHYVKSTASATGEIIYDIIKKLGVEIDTKIADCLFCSICTDTGCFKYSNVTAKTHRIAANLIECGAHAAEINRQMFGVKSQRRIKVESQALSSMDFSYGGKCAIMILSIDMIKSSGADMSDLDGISALPRVCEGVEVGITMRETAKDRYKISTRTASYVDASKLCAQFGGGGHKRAAGCEIHGTEQQVRELLLDAVGKYIGEQR